MQRVRAQQLQEKELGPTATQSIYLRCDHQLIIAETFANFGRL